ncbi:hypothetical protein DSL72_006616 [Monilinia vaccinii-corymbosi]|uniref:Uncharacterized protein n=1 Tax=Monilinia vaccinii-corymbosi TaxID=61207 RepID=A0A8A3PNY5_9HELO|nr:hypothetical protein DSL72_006616 [Monilinia vaccinii-corymbosi]
MDSIMDFMDLMAFTLLDYPPISDSSEAIDDDPGGTEDIIRLRIVGGMFGLSFQVNDLWLSSTIVGAASIPPVVGLDQLLLFGENGRTEVVDRAEFMKKYIEKNDTMSGPPLPEGVDPSIYEKPILENNNGTDNGHEHILEGRGCQSHDVIYEYPTHAFSDWDIAMSPVERTGPKGSSIAVNQGVSVADSVATQWTLTLTFILDYLQGAYGETYTHTWTTSYNVASTFPLPENVYALIVSNPWVVRRTGHVSRGCIGEGRISEYTANKHTLGNYNGLEWVQGIMGACSYHTYPVPFCIGKGVHR